MASMNFEYYIKRGIVRYGIYSFVINALLFIQTMVGSYREYGIISALFSSAIVGIRNWIQLVFFLILMIGAYIEYRGIVSFGSVEIPWNRDLKMSIASQGFILGKHLLYMNLVELTLLAYYGLPWSMGRLLCMLQITAYGFNRVVCIPWGEWYGIFNKRPEEYYDLLSLP